MGDVEKHTDDGVVAEVALVKPLRPNSDEVRAQTQQLTASIEKYAARIQEIKELTNNRRGSRAEFSAEERALMKELHDTRGSFQTTQRKKQSIRDELNKANEVRASLRTKVRQFKESSNISSLDEIDGQIKRIEERLNITDMSHAEEVECVAQIRQLVRSRETVRGLRRQLDLMQADETTCEDLMERLKDVDSELDKHKAKEKEVTKALEQMRKQKEDEVDISALNAEKNECWQVLCALRDKKKEINDAFTQKMDVFHKEEKEFRAQKRMLDKKRDEEKRTKPEAKEKSERPVVKEFAKPEKLVRRQQPERSEKRQQNRMQNNDEWLKEKERKKAEQRQRQKEHQHIAQVQAKLAACDSLLSYLSLHEKQLAKIETPLPAETAATSSPSTVLLAPGLKELKKGVSEESDAWLLGGKGKKEKHKKTKKSTKVERPEDKILMHSLQIYQEFNDLKVAPPDTLADIPKAIQTLKELKHHFQTEKLEKAELSPAREPAEEIKSETNPPPAAKAEDTPDVVLSAEPSLEKRDEELEPPPPLMTEPSDGNPEEAQLAKENDTFNGVEIVSTPKAGESEEEHLTPTLVQTTEELDADPEDSMTDTPTRIDELKTKENGIHDEVVTAEEEKLVERLSQMERTKNQLPATLEDLDPIVSNGGVFEDFKSEPAVEDRPVEHLQDELLPEETYVHCHLRPKDESAICVELEVTGNI